MSKPIRIPFTDYPRRVVTLPDGSHVLVLRRRNVDAKYRWLRWSWDYDWELKQLSRLLRRDHRWRVEAYNGVEEDPGRVPLKGANRTWIAEDRAAACALAERVCDRLVRDGGLCLRLSAEEMLADDEP